MDAKTFYEENANNTWWNAHSDMIEIKSGDLWSLMDSYLSQERKKIEGYKKICRMAGVPDLLIEHPNLFSKEYITDKDIEWAKDEIKEYIKNG